MECGKNRLYWGSAQPSENWRYSRSSWGFRRRRKGMSRMAVKPSASVGALNCFLRGGREGVRPGCPSSPHQPRAPALQHQPVAVQDHVRHVGVLGVRHLAELREQAARGLGSG